MWLQYNILLCTAAFAEDYDVDDNSDNSNQEHYGNHSDDCCLRIVILAITFVRICRYLCDRIPQQFSIVTIPSIP